MPARQGKIRQKRHHFLFHLIIDIKTKLTALFLFKQIFNVYNGRDRVFHDFSNLFDSRSQTINKHTFIQFNSDCKIKGLCYFHGFLKIIFRNKVLSYHSAIPQNTVGTIQCNNSVIRNISYFMKVACRSTGSNDYSNSTVMNLPKGINRGWQHFMSFKTYQCSIHIEHDRFYHNTYIFIHSSTI